MKVLKVILFVWIIVLGMVISSHASTQYLFPTDCANLDEQSVDDGDTTVTALTTSDTVCTLPNLTGSGYNIIRVSIIAISKRTSGTPSVIIGVKDGANTNTCTRYVGYTYYAAFGCDWETNPWTASDWTIADVNALSATIRESAVDITATQLYAVIETTQHETNHTGVLLPTAYIKYGVSNNNNGHSWFTSGDTDGLSPAGTAGAGYGGDAIWLWERDGYLQDEGYYLGSFMTENACHASANAYWAMVMRYQPNGDRYELWMSCDSAVTNQATLALKRCISGTCTTISGPIEVTGSNINPYGVVLVKISGIADPVFTVSVGWDTGNGKTDSALTYTDTNAAAIEVSGRWGFHIDEHTSNWFGMVQYYPISFGSSFGIKVTGIPTGYSAKIIDKWGNTISTTAETSGTAVVPWAGYRDERVWGVPGLPNNQGSFSLGMVQGIIGNLQIVNGSGVVVADTGLSYGLHYGQVWAYASSKKLYDYRLGNIEDSVSYGGKRKIKVWYQLDRPGTISATCFPACTASVEISHLAKDEYVGVLLLDNLSPSSLYSYSILVDTVEEGTGQFRSGPLSTSDITAKLCWSSCIPMRAMPYKIGNTIAIANSGDCDLFIMQGDTPYSDENPETTLHSYTRQHLATFREVAANYKSYRIDPNWRDLFHSMPVMFILNDHEVCDNYVIGDENRDPRNYTAGMCSGWPIEASQKSYKLYSHYGNPVSPKTGKYWYSMKWGKSDHYFPDQTFERNTPESNMDFLYYYGQNPTGSEIQPSCSRDGTTLNYLNCSGETFTSETTAFDVGTDGDAMVLFPNDSTGKYYQILSVVDADTLSLFRDEDENGSNDNIAVAGPATTRIWKDWKNSHGADQAVWLFNKWRTATNPIQVFWSSYPLFGHRNFTGIYKYLNGDPGWTYCPVNDCGFGYEHDLIINELQTLSSGKKVLIPTGDEHNVRLSKWSTYDIYELLVSGLSQVQGAEKHNIPSAKESRYSGLSIKLDAGGQPNWGILTVNTSAPNWALTVRNEVNANQAWWDGANIALGNTAWGSSVRGLDTTVTPTNYPEWIYHTGGPHTIRLNGYCWKIATEYNRNNRSMVRRSGDTACKDWLSSNAYTYDLNIISPSNIGGTSLSVNSSGELVVIYFVDGSDGLMQRCTLTGTPPTISSCINAQKFANDGTLTTSTLRETTCPFSGLGNCLNFDNTDKSVTITPIDGDINTNAGTIEAYISLSSTTDTAVVYSSRVDANNNIEIYWYEAGGTFDFKYKAGGVVTQIQTASLLDTTGGNHQVVLTWDKAADQVKAYIDGSQVGSTVTGLGTWSGTITNSRIGQQGVASPAADSAFHGKITQVAVWDTALSSTVISARYSSGSGTGCQSHLQGLISCYAFSEGAGTSTRDDGTDNLEDSYSISITGNNIHIVGKSMIAAQEVDMVTSSNGGTTTSRPFKINNDADTTNPHFPKIVKINNSNDQMIMWFVRNTGVLSARRCNVGADSLCQSGELQTRSDIVTDTLIANQAGAQEFPDIASLGDGTAVVAYITKSASTAIERSSLKYSYYNGTSWSSPSEIPGAGYRLWDARVFIGGGFYWIAAIDESLDKIIMYYSSNGTTWNLYSSSFESSLGKMRMDISQVDSNNVIVTYLSSTDANNYLENDEYSVWGQSATQIWTYSSGQWRLWNVNPNHNTINRSIN